MKKSYVTQFKNHLFILPILLISSVAHAQLQVDVAIPNGYKIDNNFNYKMYDNAESIKVYQNSFVCMDSSCGQNNKLYGFTLIVEHSTARANIIGGSVWFNIYDTQNNYITSCNLVSYTDDFSDSESLS